VLVKKITDADQRDPEGSGTFKEVCQLLCWVFLGLKSLDDTKKGIITYFFLNCCRGDWNIDINFFVFFFFFLCCNALGIQLEKSYIQESVS
jgi:hypothetical protein